MSNQGDKSHHKESVISEVIQNAGPAQKQSFASKNANAYQSRELRTKKLSERLYNIYQEKENSRIKQLTDHNFSQPSPQIDLSQYYSYLQEQESASASPMTFFDFPFHKAQQNKSSENIVKKQEFTSFQKNQIQEDSKVIQPKANVKNEIKKPPFYKDYMNKVQEQNNQYPSLFGNDQYPSPFGDDNSMTLIGLSPQDIGEQYPFKHNFQSSSTLSLKQISHKQKQKEYDLQSLMEEYDYPPIQKPVYPPALKAYSQNSAKIQQYNDNISYLNKVDYLFQFNIHDLTNMDFVFQSIVITRAYESIKQIYQESQKEEQIYKAFNSWSRLYDEVQRRKHRNIKKLSSF